MPSEQTDSLIGIIQTPLLDKLSLYYTDLKTEHRKLALVCWLINYLQLYSLLLKTAYHAFGNHTTGMSAIFYNIFRLFTISEFLDYESGDIFPGLLYLAIIFYLFSLLVQSIIIVIFLKRGSAIPRIVRDMWRGICHIHPNVLFFPIHNISLQIISNYSENKLFSNSPSAITTALFVLAIICLVLNAAITALPMIFLETLIHSKDILSSKNHFMDYLTLSQKVIIPILLAFSPATDNQSPSLIYSMAISVSLLFLAQANFYYTLPYYKVDILKIAGTMHISLLIYASITLVSYSVFDSYTGEGFLFVNGSWLFLCPIILKSYLNHLETVLNSILSKPHKLKNPYYLIHYWHIYKHYASRPQRPQKRSFSEAYIRSLGTTFNVNPNSCLSSEQMESPKQNKIILEFIKDILEAKCKKYRSNFLLRSSLILHVVRFGNSYVYPYYMLEELIHKKPPFAIRTSLQRLKLELQIKILTKYGSMAHHQEDRNSLDLQKYITMNSAYQQLRDKIEKQLTYQSMFWEHFTSLEPDFLQLIHYSKNCHEKKVEVEKEWQHFENQREIEFISPLLLYGIYSSIANNDALKEDQYLEKYYRTAERIRDQLQADEFTNKTLFSEENFVVTITSSLKALGRIVDVSSNFQDYIGLKKEYVIGKSVGIIQSPFFRDRHDDILRRHFESGTTRVLGKALTLPVLNAEGYVMPCCAEFQINPQVHHDISYMALFRKMKNHKRLVLVKENGEIDGYSKDFARDMGITEAPSDQNKLNIFSFSKEFETVNSAFNQIAKQKIENNNLEVPPISREIVEKYSIGSDIIFESMKDQSLVDYSMKVDLLIIENDFIKILYLTNKFQDDEIEEDVNNEIELPCPPQKEGYPTIENDDQLNCDPLNSLKKTESLIQPIGDESNSFMTNEYHSSTVIENETRKTRSREITTLVKLKFKKLKTMKVSAKSENQNSKYLKDGKANFKNIADMKKQLKKNIFGAQGYEASSVKSSIQLGGLQIQTAINSFLEGLIFLSHKYC